MMKDMNMGKAEAIAIRNDILGKHWQTIAKDRQRPRNKGVEEGGCKHGHSVC
jgi:hypothetical protein